jgi:PAS domain S-box-containing protein
MSVMLSVEFVRSALESSPDATIIINPSGSILFANQQLFTIFGYSREEILGQSVERLLPERFRDRHVGHRIHFAAEGRLRPMGLGLDLFARRKDGSEFPVEISLSPIRDGEQLFVAAAIRDVTDRKRVQEELIRARQAADEARELADRANRAKSRFLATASHDLRQPLQSLALLNGTLRRSLDDREALEEALDYQDQAIAAMARLLNALLDITKLESGAVKPQPADVALSTIIEELRHEFTSLAAGKGLQLQVAETHECLHTDPALLGQVLRNLVSNAIKYTHSGSVRLASRATADAVRIEVTDTGIGIPADQIPLIYDEFYQVGVGPNTSRDGYGLGLSIVRRIVSLLGIRLEVQSQPGKGSTFALEVPAGSPGSDVRPVTARPTANGDSRQAPQILLIEDDLAVRNATRMLLRAEGFRVLVAASLAEAQAAARGQPIDLLVSDYHLTDQETGPEVIAALRKMQGDDLKAVLITGDTSAAVRNLQQDARLRLARKPINADEFLSLIRELLAGSAPQ